MKNEEVSEMLRKRKILPDDSIRISFSGGISRKMYFQSYDNGVLHVYIEEGRDQLYPAERITNIERLNTRI